MMTVQYTYIADVPPPPEDGGFAPICGMRLTKCCHKTLLKIYRNKFNKYNPVLHLLLQVMKKKLIMQTKSAICNKKNLFCCKIGFWRENCLYFLLEFFD